MSELDEKPTPDQAEERFRELLRDNDMPQPDEVEHDPVAEELLFLWHESKLAVVIELSDQGPTDVREGEYPAAA